MEHKPHFARQTNKDLPTGKSHIKDHIIKYEDGEVVSRCEQYYKKLAEVHGQNPTTTQKAQLNVYCKAHNKVCWL